VVTHPDRTGGIGFLSDPSIGFAPFFTGMSALAAASWGNVMLAKGVPAQDFLAEGVLLLVIALIVTLGPLAMFSPHLLSARVQGRREYSALALDYSRAFHARWVQSRDPARLLGTGDIEPLANLADVYSGVKSVRLAPFGRQTALMIAILTLLPVGVLLLSDIPIADLTKGLVRLLVPVGI